MKKFICIYRQSSTKVWESLVRASSEFEAKAKFRASLGISVELSDITATEVE